MKIKLILISLLVLSGCAERLDKPKVKYIKGELVALKHLPTEKFIVYDRDCFRGAQACVYDLLNDKLIRVWDIPENSLISLETTTHNERNYE